MLTSLWKRLIPNRAHATAAGPSPDREGQLRVLYFIIRYPTFSETYMHEELRSVWPDYDVRVVSCNAAHDPRQRSFPHQVVPYDDSCLVYGPIDKVNRPFTSKAQRVFLERVGTTIDAFKPHVLHAHYFGLALLLHELGERYGIPFTIRTHSMDVLSEPPEKLEALGNALASRWCLRVLTFPAFRDVLIRNGAPADKVIGCWPVVNYQRFHTPERRPPTGRILCAGPAIRKKAHTNFIDLAVRMRDEGFAFRLYARGPRLEDLRSYNAARGDVVTITYAYPDEMPGAYRDHDWLVYPSDPTINKVGLPVSIAEAQASGLGVCWQELPGRRAEQLEYLGGAGYLYRSLDELPAVLRQPYPEEMRLRGIENASKCDIERHKHLLTDAWGTATEKETPRGAVPPGAD